MGTGRTLDPASAQLSDCFTAGQLKSYRYETVPASLRSRIFKHLNVDKCQRCTALYQSIEDNPEPHIPDVTLSDSVTDKFRTMLKQSVGQHFPAAPPLSIEIGQVWNLSVGNRDHNSPAEAVQESIPIMIVSSGDMEGHPIKYIRVLPLSFDTDFHKENETCLFCFNNGLEVLCELFNEMTVHSTNLKTYLGKSDQKDIDHILGLRESYFSQQPIHNDTKWETWKLKEIEIAACFSIPETVREEAFVLSPIRKAADSNEFDMAGFNFYPLHESRNWSLTLVQERDRVSLQFVSDKHQPDTVRFNRIRVTMEKVSEGDFIADLFKLPGIPERLEISIIIDGHAFVFFPQLISNAL